MELLYQSLNRRFGGLCMGRAFLYSRNLNLKDPC
nr:MAG TPA: hypothetical protein [Caudoviricetes sp.]